MRWPALLGIVALAATAASSAQVPLARTYPLVGADRSAVGTMTLTEAPRGLLVRIDARGLEPGWHAAHFHAVADCSDTGFKASGGHIHGRGVAGSVHGLLNPFATDLGDLPNIRAAADGAVQAELFAPELSLGAADGRFGLLDADGSALVIHAGPDDHLSQPIGGAGARVACAAIR